MSETKVETQATTAISVATEPLIDHEENIKIKPMRLNRTQKKLIRFERKRANAKQKKEEKRLKRKLESEEKLDNANDESSTKKPKPIIQHTTPYIPKTEGYLNHRDLKKLKRERLKKVYEDSSNSLKICIDCSFSDKMSTKEMSRLAQQIGRCHASNKSLESPVHLTLCNLNKESSFYKELCRRNDGFTNFIIEQTEESIEKYYIEKMKQVAYMSPDSPNYIEEIDVNTTYVIGGLVDETVSKKVTIDKCKHLKISSYSLPIEKYMSRQESNEGNTSKVFNYSKILAINQVFDILADFFVNKNWPRALDCGVPKRKGFCIENTKEKE